MALILTNLKRELWVLVRSPVGFLTREGDVVYGVSKSLLGFLNREGDYRRLNTLSSHDS